MENASKALLIAAGILIAIILIAIGIKVFNNSGVTEEVAYEAGESMGQLLGKVQAKKAKEFTEKIDPYLSKDGTRRSHNEILQLIETIKELNKKYEGVYEVKIVFNNNTELATVEYAESKIKTWRSTGSRYTDNIRVTAIKERGVITAVRLYGYLET